MICNEKEEKKQRGKLKEIQFLNTNLFVIKRINNISVLNTAKTTYYTLLRDSSQVQHCYMGSHYNNQLAKNRCNSKVGYKNSKRPTTHRQLPGRIQRTPHPDICSPKHLGGGPVCLRRAHTHMLQITTCQHTISHCLGKANVHGMQAVQLTGLPAEIKSQKGKNFKLALNR